MEDKQILEELLQKQAGLNMQIRECNEKIEALNAELKKVLRAIIAFGGDIGEIPSPDSIKRESWNNKFKSCLEKHPFSRPSTIAKILATSEPYLTFEQVRKRVTNVVEFYKRANELEVKIIDGKKHYAFRQDPNPITGKNEMK